MPGPPPATALLDELERSRRMLAEAQQLARIGSWEWDVGENRVTWSDELFRIYGYPPHSFEPSYEAFLSHVHADDRQSVDERNHKAFADHQTVNHSIKEYARGEAHTNTIEGVFSVFKRGMIGTYQHCGSQHLQRYLAEFDFRYNHRAALEINDNMRVTDCLKGIEGKRLTYRRSN